MFKLLFIRVSYIGETFIRATTLAADHKLKHLDNASLLIPRALTWNYAYLCIFLFFLFVCLAWGLRKLSKTVNYPTPIPRMEV